MKKFIKLVLIMSIFIGCSEKEKNLVSEKIVESYESVSGNSLQISLPSDTLTSSDSVSIEISLKYKKEYVPQFPDWQLLKDSLNIIDIKEIPATEDSNGFILRTIVLRLANLIPGDYIINPLEFTLLKENSAVDSIVTDYISLKIHSVLLEDSTDIIETLEPVTAENHTLKYIVVILGIILAVGTGLYIGVKYYQSRQTSDLDFHMPYELRIKQCPMEGGQNFYFRLSAILKEYLDNKIFLSVQSQTTEEFIGFCRNSPLLEDWLKEQLFDFLKRSDEVSFGKRDVSEEQMKGDIQFCLDFIQFIDEKMKKEAAGDI